MEILELYTLNISNFWDPIDNKNFWEATVEIPDICSLFNFHLFIQHIIGFDNNHLFEFYRAEMKKTVKSHFQTTLAIQIMEETTKAFF